MIRQVIKIDEEKCNGCGICANACHESAIAIVDGKAKLIRDDYCDGMGDCLPSCPVGAISFETREALAYDEEAVKANMLSKQKEHMQTQAESGQAAFAHQGCPGSRMRQMNRSAQNKDGADQHHDGGLGTAGRSGEMPVQTSMLQNWPVQIKLAPVKAPYYAGAKLLIAADCTAYAYANMHRDFIKGKITLIGCPKLDDVDYHEKLQAIIEGNDIQSVTIVRMEVPCCGGLEMAAKRALQNSGKFLPWQVVTISIDGDILE